MSDLSQTWRLFLQSVWLQAGAMGLGATILALSLGGLAPATFTALDWTAYDTWLRQRAPVQISPSLLLITRDQASETKFGTGPWDRAVLARFITAAHNSGATAIGLDHRIAQPSQAQLGGAASDALLLEATRNAGPVVYPYETESPLTSEAMVLSHLLVSPSQDHVTRTVPLSAELGTESVPAFGLALYKLTQPQANQTGTIALVNYAGDGTLGNLPTLSFAALWEALETHHDERLDSWFKDKVVVFLPDPTPAATWLLPTGQSVSGSAIHLHLLNMLLTDNRVCRLGLLNSGLVTLLLASLVAWFLLHAGGSRSFLFAGAVVLVYGCLLVAALALAHLVLPLALPLSALALVFVGATVWTHLTAGQRMVLLERDMLRVQQEAVAVREALVLRENRAEALQEDLDQARAAVAQSTGRQQDLSRSAETLRTELTEVQAQEEAARQQLQDLGLELAGLRAVTESSRKPGDAELEQLRDECRKLGIVTQNHHLLGLFRDLKKGAKSQLPALLLGEAGTGKELFARAIHLLSPRSGKPFIAVNMAAISPELFESELFGHVRGSFTGATMDRRGYFELAHHGTLFLDEIGDLRLEHQGKLLRVLQEKTFYRVGATTPTTVDVRVVAATNRDLQRGVSEGWFREDLYFRLKGLVFRLPPLQDRKDDIGLLAEHYLTGQAQQLGREAPRLTQDALDALLQHEWKGNVRELRQCLEQAVALAEGPLLTKDDLRLQQATATTSSDRARTPKILPEPAGDAAVLDCLRLNGFDMQATAKALGWDRSTVTQRLKGLCFQALVDTSGDKAQAAATLAGDPSLTRTVELKLMDYYEHLLATIQPFATVEEALADCKRRFKNLPDRHFKSVEILVKQAYAQKAN
ncbi:MAG: sigma 54-interacting transcriptional regulator [Nitrospirota bacterium]|nr:sigma 54-interacting transcriptional regulator [Nitrospirota bacterium]MDP2383330.1 sigma 54-interacting transcriptional regulator [Nitrospirota bacterium]